MSREYWRWHVSARFYRRTCICMRIVRAIATRVDGHTKDTRCMARMSHRVAAVRTCRFLEPDIGRSIVTRIGHRVLCVPRGGVLSIPLAFWHAMVALVSEAWSGSACMR